MAPALRVLAPVLAAAVLAACTSASGRSQTPTTPPQPQPTVTSLVGQLSSEAAGDRPTEPGSSRTEPSAGEATEAAGASSVLVYLVTSSPRGEFVTPEERLLPEPTLAVARAAFTELLEQQPADPHLVSTVPAGTRLLDVARDADVLVVDVSAGLRRAGGGSTQERLLAEQLAHTAAQFPEVTSVLLRVDGRRISDLWGHLDWSQPVRPDEAALAPVIITEPSRTATIPTGEVTVSGTANVFEATVALKLTAPDGTVVEETFTTATCGTGCRGSWKHTFAEVDAPGTWTLEAADSDASDGEGPGPFRATRTFEVR